MRKLFFAFAILLIAIPATSLAEDLIVEEYDIVEISSPDDSKTKELAYDRGDAGYGERSSSEALNVPPPKSGRSFNLKYRQGSFRAGIVGPGYAWANRGAGSMMTIGPEIEYFFWEKLSALMRIWVATDFEDITVLSFLPMVRYVFDLERHPRWSIYVQGGVGLALYNAEHPAADIAIPGGGFWWQWTSGWSVGAEAQLHILARSRTAVGFTIAPAIRYQF